MKQCDTFLMVGSAFPYSEFLPKPGDARGVQIDIDGANLSLRYPMEYSLIGDSKETLAALLPLLEQNKNTSWRQGIEKDVSEWWDTLRARAMEPADPVNPQRIFHELSPRLPDDVIITGDSGSVANWYARDIRMRRGMMGSLSAARPRWGPPRLRSLGENGLPPSPRDRLHRRRRDADERAQRHDHGEQILATLVEPDIHPDGAQQRGFESGHLGGARAARGRQDAAHPAIPDFPYQKYAELLGFKGIYCDDPEKIGAAWDEALASDRPVIMNMKADPNVPPLPPHITLKDAKNFMTMMADEPELASVIKNSAKQMFASVLPGKD